MENCIFCKIVSGEIPSFKVAENSKAMAFLDANPSVAGHALVIPKKHFEGVFDIPKEELTETMLLVKEIALRMKKNLNAGGVNIINSSGKAAQQEVMHLHFHLIPRFDNDGIDAWAFKRGLPKAQASKEVAEKIRK